MFTIYAAMRCYYLVVLLAGAQVESELTSLNLRTGRPSTESDNTRCCIIQFDLLMISTIVLETCTGI